MIEYINVTADDIQGTKGQFFGIEWVKNNGELRVANAHVKNTNFNGDYLRVFDRNKKDYITINLKKVTYLRKGGVTRGKTHLKGKKGQRILASGV